MAKRISFDDPAPKKQTGGAFVRIRTAKPNHPWWIPVLVVCTLVPLGLFLLAKFQKGNVVPESVLYEFVYDPELPVAFVELTVVPVEGKSSFTRIGPTRPGLIRFERLFPGEGTYQVRVQLRDETSVQENRIGAYSAASQGKRHLFTIYSDTVDFEETDKPELVLPGDSADKDALPAEAPTE